MPLVRPGSRIGLGCMPMSFGYVDAPGEDDPTKLIGHALDLGATMFDTADVYGPCTNEELVGRALRGRRDEAARGSLRRLQTDVLDLYYLHRVDDRVPLEETWAAMASLAEQGIVRELGISEVGVEELERAHAIHPVSAVQLELSVWTHDALADVVPWCASHDAAFVAFSPLGRGFLTGTIRTDGFDERDFRASNPRFTDRAIAANQAIVAVVRRVAERNGATPAQVAIAWTLARGPHVLAIPGTKRLRHLDENVAAATLALTPEDLAELDAAPLSVAPRY